MANSFTFDLLCVVLASFPQFYFFFFFVRKGNERENIVHIEFALSQQSLHLTTHSAPALLISVFYLRKCSYVCILLQGLWKGLLKCKLCVGHILRNSLVLEVSSSLWDKAHGGRWAAKGRSGSASRGWGWNRAALAAAGGCTILPRACKVRDPPPLLSRGHFQRCRWQGDGSLPKHSFPLISSEHRDTQAPDTIQAVEGGRWAVLSWWGELTDRDGVTLCCPFWPISGHLWYFRSTWWFVEEALPRGRLAIFNALVQSDDDMLQLSGWRTGAQNNLGPLAPAVLLSSSFADEDATLQPKGTSWLHLSPPSFCWIWNNHRVPGFYQEQIFSVWCGTLWWR